jgi:hypothetical protein
VVLSLRGGVLGMDFGSLQQIPGWRDGNESGNWPVLLVRRKKKTLPISPDLDASWFGGAQNELVDSGEHGVFQLVSRRRHRLTLTLFMLVFGAVVALLIWEASLSFLQ